MKPHCTVGLQLVELDTNGNVSGLFSRGAAMVLYGADVNYLGASPDKVAWFWIAPGDVRSLNLEQLANNGLTLTDRLAGKHADKVRGDNGKITKKEQADNASRKPVASPKLC